MSLNNYITDPSTGVRAEVTENADKHSLVVATHPLKTYNNSIRFFLNDTYGAEMNQNATAGGTPVEIHNGTDDAYWTATAIAGTWDFDSTDQAHAGTKSIDATDTGNNNIAQIAKGGDQDLTGYVSITGWVYLTAWRGGNHIELYGWDTGTGVIVGNSVYIDDYIDTNTLGSWLSFSIPLGDLGLTDETIDAVRIRTLTANRPPDYYLDDIQIEETGEPLVWTVEPDKETWLHIYSMNVTIADAYAGTIDTGSSNIVPTMPSIPYNGWLGVSELSNGVVYQRYQSGIIEETFSIKRFADLMTFSDASVTGYGSDGTNTWVSVSIKFTEPIILKEEEEDRISLILSEDLSGLLFYRTSVGAKTEYR